MRKGILPVSLWKGTEPSAPDCTSKHTHTVLAVQIYPWWPENNSINSKQVASSDIPYANGRAPKLLVNKRVLVFPLHSFLSERGVCQTNFSAGRPLGRKYNKCKRNLQIVWTNASLQDPQEFLEKRQFWLCTSAHLWRPNVTKESGLYRMESDADIPGGTEGSFTKKTFLSRASC